MNWVSTLDRAAFKLNINRTRLNIQSNIHDASVDLLARKTYRLNEELFLSAIQGKRAAASRLRFLVKYRLSFGTLFTQTRSVEIFDRPQSSLCICIGSTSKRAKRKRTNRQKKRSKKLLAKHSVAGMDPAKLIWGKGNRERKGTTYHSYPPTYSFLSFFTSSNEYAQSFNFPWRKTRIQASRRSPLPSSLHQLFPLEARLSRFTARAISYRDI